MFPPQRRDLLLKILNDRKQISVKSLAEELEVSEGTLRTDLKILEDEGSLERTHGGAVLPRSNSHEFRYFSRSDLNREEKSRIAIAAAGLVRKGQCIILDAGSTALELAKLLVDFDYLTVVTNGLESAMELNRNPRVNVILVGGVLRPSSRTVEGLLGKSILSDIHADFFFTSAEGFSLEAGLTDFSTHESELKKLMAENALKVVALLDHTKLNRRSIATSVKAEDIDILITEARADPDFMNRLTKINVMVAE